MADTAPSPSSLSSSSSSSPPSSPPNYDALLEKLRNTYWSGKTHDLKWRKTQLEQLRRLCNEKEDEIMNALKEDLGKSKMESVLSETAVVVGEITHTLSHLSSWVKPSRVATPLAQMKGLSTCEVVPEPLGVVLIIGAWNYPFNLAVGPIVPALAAGNCFVLKPSEVSPSVSSLLAKLLPKYLDNDAFAVVEGAVPETTELLKQKFDHILYTGNGTVGKIVMKAAAEHLTPVTLELGGKSPAIVDPTASIEVAARRIAWGKFYNAGQTCIAVDHVFVHQSRKKKLLDLIQENLKEFYGEDPKTSQDFGRIVNQRHVQRIEGLLKDIPKENIIVGGEVDAAHKYIAPTIVVDPPATSPLMQEEIFGPILPVIAYNSLEEVLRGFRNKEKPLAFYLFSNDTDVQNWVCDSTSSGQFVVNEVLMQFAVPDLPFGGVGASGMGSYHGESGFRTFSHFKSVLNKTTWFDLKVRYPPYNEDKLSMLRKLV